MINIQLAGKNKDREAKVKEQLERLFKEYDLEKYLFTKDVVISSFTRPTSHPILTINTKNLNNDDTALSAFLHEQFHWFEELYQKEIEKVVEELRKIYPDVPVGGEEGAKDEYSTYMHLVVCFLEYEELKKLIGENRARKVLENPFGYKWIYRKVLEDNKKLRKIFIGIYEDFIDIQAIKERKDEPTIPFDNFYKKLLRKNRK